MIHVYYFILGYLASLIGQGIIITQIFRQKHVEGISFYTQLLFSISQVIKIFYFPFTILKEYYLQWIEYVICVIEAILIMYLFKKYKRLTTSKEANYFDYRIIMAVSVALAFVSMMEKSDFTYSQLIIRYSIIQEVLGMFPQLRLMRQEKFVSKFIGYYLIFLMFSRIFRIMFWFEQWSSMYTDDTYYTLVCADLFYFGLTCDFIYNFFKYRKNTLIPYN